MHHGHLQAARFACELLARPVHLLLAPRPQLRTPCTTSYSDRWEMLKLACQTDPAFVPFDFEQSVPGPTHTIVTLKRLRQSTKENFVWIIGSDAITKVHLWYRAEELPDWLSFLVFIRSGFTDVDLPKDFTPAGSALELLERPGLIHISTRSMLDLSASMIRLLRNQGKDIKSLVTASVYDYIISKHMYEPKDSC